MRATNKKRAKSIKQALGKKSDELLIAVELDAEHVLFRGECITREQLDELDVSGVIIVLDRQGESEPSTQSA